MDCSTPASLSFTISQNLLKLMSTESVMPSNHFILCHPLLLLLSVFPNIKIFSNESTLHISWPKYWSFLQEQYGIGASFRSNMVLELQGVSRSKIAKEKHIYKALVVWFPVLGRGVSPLAAAALRPPSPGISPACDLWPNPSDLNPDSASVNCSYLYQWVVLYGALAVDHLMSWWYAGWWGSPYLVTNFSSSFSASRSHWVASTSLRSEKLMCPQSDDWNQGIHFGCLVLFKDGTVGAGQGHQLLQGDSAFFGSRYFF